jgi:hypothetical protein
MVAMDRSRRTGLPLLRGKIHPEMGNLESRYGPSNERKEGNLVTIQEFEQVQFHGGRGHLASLILLCARRFSDAAHLLGIRGREIDRVRGACSGGTDPAPLLVVWKVLCDRYRVERYDPQIGLFLDHGAELQARWGAFLHTELFPELVRENEVVRDVLRVLGLLPTTSVPESAAALANHIKQMGFPFRDSLWGTLEND